MRNKVKKYRAEVAARQQRISKLVDEKRKQAPAPADAAKEAARPPNAYLRMLARIDEDNRKK